MSEKIWPFSFDHYEARSHFLAAASSIGMPMNTYEGHSNAGDADSWTLNADIGRLGSPEASQSIILCSGRGGVSGYLLSGILYNCLKNRLYLHLPKDMSLVFVHAINPNGPCWNTIPEDTETIHHSSPMDEEDVPSWDQPILDAVDKRFMEFQSSGSFNREKLEGLPLNAIIQPAWDSSVIPHAAKRFMAEIEEAILFDFRVSPSDYGQVEITAETDENSVLTHRAQDAFPEAQHGLAQGHDSVWALTGAGMPQLFDKEVILPMVVEFGLFRQPSMMDLLAPDFGAQDQRHEDQESQMDDPWCHNAWKHAEKLILRAIDYLS